MSAVSVMPDPSSYCFRPDKIPLGSPPLRVDGTASIAVFFQLSRGCSWDGIDKDKWFGVEFVGPMRKANYFMAVASTLLGVLILYMTFQRGGVSPTVGSVFGGLLLVNGAVRLWAARAQASRVVRKDDSD